MRTDKFSYRPEVKGVRQAGSGRVAHGRAGLKLPRKDRFCPQELIKFLQLQDIQLVQGADDRDGDPSGCQRVDGAAGAGKAALLPEPVMDRLQAVQRNRHRLDTDLFQLGDQLRREQKAVGDDRDPDSAAGQGCGDLRPVRAQKDLAANQSYPLALRVGKLLRNVKTFCRGKFAVACFPAGRTAVFAGKAARKGQFPDTDAQWIGHVFIDPHLRQKSRGGGP